MSQTEPCDWLAARLMSMKIIITILFSTGMMIITITHLLACHPQAEEGVVVGERAMPIHLTIMAMKTTMMIIMATTIMTTVGAMRTLTTAMKTFTA